MLTLFTSLIIIIFVIGMLSFALLRKEKRHGIAGCSGTCTACNSNRKNDFRTRNADF